MQERDWKKERIVSIDFDGVLAHSDGWKGEDVVGDPISGGKEFILQLISKGFTPVIFTGRNADVVGRWLKENSFPALEVTAKKYPSVVYIDDKGVQFKGNFDVLAEDMKNYHVHWQNQEEKIFAEL